ncbi:MAG: CCA tRNA nucleotidyltransferase [Candidatus Eisenbacteria bacterium]
MSIRSADIERIQHAVPRGARLVVRRIQEAGGYACLVGGCLRDLVLGRPVKDWDIATDLSPEQIQPLFARVFSIGARFGTVLVPAGSRVFEVTTFRTEADYRDGRHPEQVAYTRSLDEDLRRRDFTVNAMAWAPGEDRIHDPFGGLADLEARCIRAVGEPRERFREDALRLLRAVRQATELDFVIDPGTLAAIKEEAEGLGRISAERIRDELNKILQTARPSRGLLLLHETGLLGLVLPELEQCYGVAQNRFHAHDVFLHSLYTADAAPRDNLIVRLAALLHDIGKPDTADDTEGERTFYSHQSIGARKARRLLRRLRYSREEGERIGHLIYHHMFYYQTEWSDSAVRRFVRSVGLEHIPDLIALRLADMAGNGRKSGDRRPLERLLQRVDEVMTRDAALTVKDLTIGGRELMDLGLAPGPGMGRILRALLERVLDEPELNTPEALTPIARELIESGHHLQPDEHERRPTPHESQPDRAEQPR